jgi:hypothetical protein
MKTITAFGVSGGTLIQGFLTQGLEPGSSLPNNQAQDDEEACVPNISRRERLKRLIGGVIPFVFAVAILVWLISTDANRLWRLPLFFLFVGAASGFFQWRDKT